MLGLKQYEEKGGRIDRMTEENMGEDMRRRITGEQKGEKRERKAVARSFP